jgi:hypothetical protein
MIEVPVSAYDWVPRIVDPITMADTIAGFRVLCLNFDFIIRSFYKKIYLIYTTRNGPFNCLSLLGALQVPLDLIVKSNQKLSVLPLNGPVISDRSLSQ